MAITAPTIVGKLGTVHSTGHPPFHVWCAEIDALLGVGTARQTSPTLLDRLYRAGLEAPAAARELHAAHAAHENASAQAGAALPAPPPRISPTKAALVQEAAWRLVDVHHAYGLGYLDQAAERFLIKGGAYDALERAASSFDPQLRLPVAWAAHKAANAASAAVTDFYNGLAQYNYWRWEKVSTLAWENLTGGLAKAFRLADDALYQLQIGLAAIPGSVALPQGSLSVRHSLPGSGIAQAPSRALRGPLFPAHQAGRWAGAASPGLRFVRPLGPVFGDGGFSGPEISGSPLGPRWMAPPPDRAELPWSPPELEGPFYQTGKGGGHHHHHHGRGWGWGWGGPGWWGGPIEEFVQQDDCAIVEVVKRGAVTILRSRDPARTRACVRPEALRSGAVVVVQA